MYRKVGIGMGGYVLYSTVPRHGPGVVGMGKVSGSEVRKEGRGREGTGSRLQTRQGWLSERLQLCGCIKHAKTRM